MYLSKRNVDKWNEKMWFLYEMRILRTVSRYRLSDEKRNNETRKEWNFDDINDRIEKIQNCVRGTFRKYEFWKDSKKTIRVQGKWTKDVKEDSTKIAAPISAVMASDETLCKLRRWR